jgi:hypothetical protein
MHYLNSTVMPQLLSLAGLHQYECNGKRACEPAGTKRAVVSPSTELHMQYYIMSV